MYSQHDENQQRQEDDGYDPNNVAVEEHNSAAPASDLDHALLESLFYNEMVMLETPVGGASAATATSDLPCLPTTDEHDDTAHTIVEKEILRDFGVDGGGGFFSSTATMNVSSSNQVFAPAPAHHHPQNLPQHHPIQNYHSSQQQQQQQQQQEYQYQPQQFSSTEFVPTGVNSSTNIPSTTASMVYTDSQATATAAAAAAAMLPRGSNKLASSSTISTTVPFTHHPLPQHPSDNNNNDNNNNSNNESQQGIVSAVPQDRARQLVDQFATLASRLGIDLPDSVLQSLTSAAAKNDPSLLIKNSQKPEGTTTTTTKTTKAAAKKIATKISPANVKNPPPLIATVPDDDVKGQIDSDKTVVGMAPTVMELRKTAEESIAAVTRKPRDQTTTTSTKRIDEKRKEISPESASATEGAATSTTNSNDSKPTYSKRRKKPRLSDCETKLAQLKAENEQLKRHLQNVSNKAHKFDKEKEEAGKNIARLIHDPNAGPREMGMSVRKFSDMYSDYGVNRQQELSFHLEQLQR